MSDRGQFAPQDSSSSSSSSSRITRATTMLKKAVAVAALACAVCMTGLAHGAPARDTRGASSAAAPGIGSGRCTSTSPTFQSSKVVLNAGPAHCRDVCMNTTMCVGYTTPDVNDKTHACYYYTDPSVLLKQPHHVVVANATPIPATPIPANDDGDDDDNDECLDDAHACGAYTTCCANGGYKLPGHGTVCNRIAHYAKTNMCSALAGGYCGSFFGVPASYKDAFAAGSRIRVVQGTTARLYTVTAVDAASSPTAPATVHVDTASLAHDFGGACLLPGGSSNSESALVTTNCGDPGKDCPTSTELPSTISGADGSNGMLCIPQDQGHGHTFFTGLPRDQEQYSRYQQVMGTAGKASPSAAQPDASIGACTACKGMQGCALGSWMFTWCAQALPQVKGYAGNSVGNCLHLKQLWAGTAPLDAQWCRATQTATPSPTTTAVAKSARARRDLMEVPIKYGGFGGQTWNQIRATVQPAADQFRSFDKNGETRGAVVRWLQKAIRSDESKHCQKSRFEGCCSWSPAGTQQQCGSRCGDTTQGSIWNYCHLSPTKCGDCGGHWLDHEHDQVPAAPWGTGAGQVPDTCPSNAQFYGHVPANDYTPCTGILSYDCHESTTMANICAKDSGECVHFGFDSYQELMITLLSIVPEEFVGVGRLIRGIIKRPVTNLAVTATERYMVSDVFRLLIRDAVDRMGRGAIEFLQDQFLAATMQPLIHQTGRLVALEGLNNEQVADNWTEFFQDMLREIDPTGISRIRQAMDAESCSEISPPFPRMNNDASQPARPAGLCLFGFAEDGNGFCVPSVCDRRAFDMSDSPPYVTEYVCQGADYHCFGNDDAYETACRARDRGYGVAWFTRLDGLRTECRIFTAKVQQVAEKRAIDTSANCGGACRSDSVDTGGLCLEHASLPDYRFVSSDTTTKVKCTFTVDNTVDGVWYNDVNITSDVEGNLRDWTQAKTVEFQAVPWTAYLTITGSNLESGGNHCGSAGFQITCDNGITSSTLGWEAAHGSDAMTGAQKQGLGAGWGSPCQSTSAFQLAGKPTTLKKLWGDSAHRSAAFRMLM